MNINLTMIHCNDYNQFWVPIVPARKQQSWIGKRSCKMYIFLNISDHAIKVLLERLVSIIFDMICLKLPLLFHLYYNCLRDAMLYRYYTKFETKP